MREDYDVGVVGFGPVGMVMATLLARAGYRVVVFERHLGLYNLPRAAILDDETMRTLVKLGIAPTLQPKVHAQPGYEWVNGAGELLIEHEFALVGRSGWGEWYGMYQPDLEDSLVDAITATGLVDVRFGARVVDYHDDATGVEIETQDGTRTRVRYAIATDGGNGPTREWLGAELEDFGFSEPWMVCDFALTGSPTLPMARQVCDPLQPISIISLGPSYHRFSFMLNPGDDPGVESAPEKVWRRVAKYLSPADAEIIRVATYTFRSLLADRWRSGHVLLAGDSAHQMPPFLGQGMCSGIRDAQNLAFKLDLILSGRAEDELLDTYQTERAPQVEAITRKGIELGRVQTLRDPVKAAQRDAELIANRKALRKPQRLRFPGLGEGLIAPAGAPARGELFPQYRVASSDGSRLFDDVFGYGTFLVTMGGQPLGRDLADRAARTVDKVVHIDHEADVDGNYAAWFDTIGADAVIVRPDFYLYGAATGASALDDLLGSLEQRVRPRDPASAADAMGR